MKRRAVLKAGMGGLVGMAAVESGCATAPLRAAVAAQALDPAEAEAALARIDERMAGLEQLDFDIPRDLPHHVRTTMEAKAEMTRKALRSLYLAGAFQQLDEPVRYHPGMQERVRRMQGEMDEAVHQVTEHLASLSPAERRQIQQRLAADPDLGPSLSQNLEAVAREDGFRFSQRTHLRVTFSDLERGMRTPSASVIIDRSVQRSRAMRARADPMSERTYVAQMGEAAFRDLRQRAVGYAAAWEHVYAARPRVDLARLDEVYPDAGGGGPGPAAAAGSSGEQWTEPPRPAGPVVLTVGGWMLGIGAIAEATGLVLFFGVGGGTSTGVAATVGILLCVFIGPILLALGLIVGLVGLIVMAATPSPGSAQPRAVPPAAAPPSPAPPPAPPGQL